MSLFPLSSPIDALREYFSRMDIEMLDLILDEKNTYNDLKKSLFLEKLNHIFEEFRKSGDTRLELHHGECSNCFRHCRGYTLLGNNSSNYLDLLVKQENGEIKDIFYCSELINYGEIEKNSPFILNFEPDEAADFAEDEDYLLLVFRCKQAMEHWDNYRGKIVYHAEMEHWLGINASIYEDCIGYFMYSRHQDFFDFYRNLDNIFRIFLEKDKIISEVLHLDYVVQNGHYDEKEMLNWLLINEETGRSEAGEIDEYTDGSEFDSGRILLDSERDLYLDENEFKVFFDYQKNFRIFYTEKLKQYSVYSSEELDSMEPDTEEFQQAGSLRYNLDIRKKSGSMH